MSFRTRPNGEHESQYVAVRGITPNLNYVSVDGIGMISVANGGAGQRRVDLALIPSQAARKTEIYKTFTADQDAGAIGGVINIVPYSVYGLGRDKFYIDAFINYVTDNDVPGGNSLGGYKDSPWSGGVKSLWTHRFGADQQFGLSRASPWSRSGPDCTRSRRNKAEPKWRIADGLPATHFGRPMSDQRPGRITPASTTRLQHHSGTRTFSGPRKAFVRPSD